jgi:hypothetical protein
MCDKCDTPNVFTRPTAEPAAAAAVAAAASARIAPLLTLLAAPDLPAAKAWPATPGALGSRRRLWDLPAAAMCPVIGVCVPMALLRRRLGKTGPLTGTGGASGAPGNSDAPDDYALHCLAISECNGRRTAVASALQRELDQRYAAALRHFNAHKSTAELAVAWGQALQCSDIAGSFWATLTHARCDALLQEQVLRDIHMLQHQVGAANRADVQRLAALSEENIVLGRELGRVQARSTRLLSERAVQTDVLQATLMRLRGELLARDTLVERLQGDLQRLEASVPGLRRQQQHSTNQAEQIRRQQSRLQHLDGELLVARQQLARQAACLTDQAAALACPPPAATVAAPSSGPNFDTQSVLCVGGRQGVVPIYRQLIERTGGRFLHHDGGEEHAAAQLDASLAAADLVICQTGCISHDAYWRVKDHCKRTGKRCVFVDKPSASGLRRALSKLGQAEAVEALANKS